MLSEDRVPVDPDPFGDGGFADDPVVHSTPAPPQALAPVSLTEEQQRRIELNKQLALERRLARLKAHSGQDPLALPLAHPASSLW